MLSKKTQYALKALSYLAEHYAEGPVLIADIAAHKQIPLKFLESILLNLKHHDLLDSKKGKGGGYFLKQAPKKISVAKAICAVEGKIELIH